MQMYAENVIECVMIWYSQGYNMCIMIIILTQPNTKVISVSVFSVVHNCLCDF